MPLDQLRNANFGTSKANATGSSGVGYALLDISGSVISPRTTVGVYQLTSGSGLYAAYVTFPDEFRGQIVWDTGLAFASKSYALDQYNVEENNPLVRSTWAKLQQVSGKVDSLYDMGFGRWHIINNQMVFYKEDNFTEIARFDLFDDTGTPTTDAVFERTKA